MVTSILTVGSVHLPNMGALQPVLPLEALLSAAFLEPPWRADGVGELVRTE